MAESALKSLSERPDIPVKPAYRAAYICRKVGKELETWYSQRDKFIKELGRPTEDGKSIEVTIENMQEYMRRMTELGAIEVTIECEPLDVATLPDTFHIMPKDLLQLGPFVVML